MRNNSSCASCGHDLPAELPGSLCPACLFLLATPINIEISRERNLNEIDTQSIQELLTGYEIIEVIGRGGMGVVYRARQKSLDRMVAVKVLNEAFVEAFKERFEREARILGKITHPNIVAIHDYGIELGVPYIVTELFDSKNLALIIKQKQIPLSEAIAILDQIVDAVGFLHLHKIIHRDIKPSNILVSVHGDVKLIDLGIAKIGRDSSVCDRSTLTQTGDTMGTVFYMAPELLDNAHTADQRADLFSIGVVFYELIVGKPPMGAYTPASKIIEGIDSRVDAIIDQCIADSPENRFQSIGELKESLQELRFREKVRSHNLSTLLYRLAALSLGLMTVVYFLTHHDRNQIVSDTDQRNQRDQTLRSFSNSINDPFGNTTGDKERAYLDITDVVLSRKGNYYEAIINNAADLPTKEAMRAERNCDFILWIDADQNTTTGQNSSGNDYNVHATLTNHGWVPLWIKVSSFSRSDRIKTDQNKIKAWSEGSRVVISFPTEFLPYPSFDWWVESTTRNAPDWPPVTGNPPTQRSTFAPRMR